jgi:hypothetical protein
MTQSHPDHDSVPPEGSQEVQQEAEVLPIDPLMIDLANSLSWIGIALIGFFITGVVFQIFPIRILDPAWLQKLGAVVITTGMTPMIGAVLILVAPLACPDFEALERRAWLVRRLAILAAIGYLLMIPLQAHAGSQILFARRQEQVEILNQVRSATKALQQSRSEPELREAYKLLPGQKPILGDQFDVPFEIVKQNILKEISPSLKRAETVFAEQMNQFWQQWFAFFTQTTLRLLFLFIGFAAIAQRSPRSYPLLETVFMILRGARRAKHPSQQIPDQAQSQHEP